MNILGFVDEKMKAFAFFKELTEQLRWRSHRSSFSTFFKKSGAKNSAALYPLLAIGRNFLAFKKC